MGVVDADLGLRGGDLRAAERTYQLLAQATGRAGRKDKPGRALLQTWAPEHAVMQALAAQDRDAFVEAEMAERELAGLPPFGRLAAVVVSGLDPAQLEAFAQAMAKSHVSPSALGAGYVTFFLYSGLVGVLSMVLAVIVAIRSRPAR